MASTELVLEIVDVLRKRKGILACLLEEPRDKATLCNELEIPRSTLDRAIRELESIGMVAYIDGEYAVTASGKRLVRDFFRFIERAELTLELEPFLQWLPPDESDFDIQWLDEAELFVPTDADPYAIINRHVQLLRETDHMRGLLPVVGLHAYEAAHENIVENEAEAELTIETDVAEVVTSTAPFAELTEEMLETGRLEISVYDGSVPYFIGVFDDNVVQIGVGEYREPRAMVETDRREVLTWADERLAEYKRGAERLSGEAERDFRRPVNERKT
ncbi:helix-turn-helix transcriptional regulator [Natrinema amylolyticum]|uniref:helix-turn-helix transcriptional regulator n=1 Tax=Natrinema amylolyticum TaxID=2878679 RepID=UPI001CF9D03A|nr:hypothetical protein [Natrinema amylolyticum]